MLPDHNTLDFSLLKQKPLCTLHSRNDIRQFDVIHVTVGKIASLLLESFRHVGGIDPGNVRHPLHDLLELAG